MSEHTLPIILQNYVKRAGPRNKVFDFERIEPIGDVPDCYEQRFKKWGTESNSFNLYIGITMLEFYTAWLPPIPIIKKLAMLHKDMTFRLEYYQSRYAFRGIAIAKWVNGEVLFSNQCWDMTEKDFRELELE
jgi:hypothetical protein